MAKVTLYQIKEWFKKYQYPTQAQFWDTWDSFWHKDESIPVERIDGIQEVLDGVTQGFGDELALKQNKTDENLQTSDKTIVGAINETVNGISLLQGNVSDAMAELEEDLVSEINEIKSSINKGKRITITEEDLWIDGTGGHVDLEIDTYDTFILDGVQPGYRNFSLNLTGQVDYTKTYTIYLSVGAPRLAIHADEFSWSNTSSFAAGAMIEITPNPNTQWNVNHYLISNNSNLQTNAKEIVAAINEVNAKINDTEFSLPLRRDITAMFDFPSNARFRAWLEIADENDLGVVFIRAQDTTGIANDLVITAQSGFGSYQNKLHAGSAVTEVTNAETNETEYEFAPYAITITAETEDANTQVFVPKECNTVDVFYFVGTKEIVSSYVVDNQGVYYNFELENTPIENFLLENIQSNNENVVINGTSIHKNNIVELHFGESYNAIATIGDFFVRYFYNLQTLNVSGLANVTSVGEGFLEGTPISTFNILQLPKLQSVGAQFLGYNNVITEIDFQGRSATFADYMMLSSSQLRTVNISGIQTIGGGAFNDCSSLTALIVDVNTNIDNASNLNFSGCQNHAACTIFGEAGALDDGTVLTGVQVAQRFQALHSNLSNWSVADYVPQVE